MSKLFLDDIREPIQVTHAWHKGEWDGFPSLYPWKIVRSYAEFTEYILKNGLPEVISFDHDLSWEHYPQGELLLSNPINYDEFTEKTGYDCAKWLVDYCETNEHELPDFYVHSFNPIGRANIIDYLVRYKEIKAEEKTS